MQAFHFLSGLPRSGSTLLTALLNQHPAIHASANSPVLDLIHYTEEFLFVKSEQYRAHPKPESARKLLSSIPALYYFDRPEPVIVDKSRGWVNQIGHIKDYITESPRVLCPVRDIADILVSFLVLLEKSGPQNYIDDTIRKSGAQPTNQARCDFLMSMQGSVGMYCAALSAALRKGWGQYILLVEYDNLVADPQREMNRIYEFLGIDPHEHDTTDVTMPFQEKDSAYGLEGMHTVRPVVEKITRDRDTYLPPDVQTKVRHLEFWRR